MRSFIASEDGLRSTRRGRCIVAKLFALVLIACLASPPSDFAVLSPASASDKSASDTAPQQLPSNVEPPRYTPGSNPFHDGERLLYQASWLGIPAGGARIEIHRDAASGGRGRWRIEAWIQTNRAVDVVFRMRDYARETFFDGTFRPVDFLFAQRENKRKIDYRVAFDRPPGVATASRIKRSGTETHSFRTINSFGPASGAVMALSQQLRPGDNVAFDVIAGTNRYVFAFDIAGADKISTAAGTFDAVKIVPAVSWTSNESMRTETRATTVWVSTDARRLPVRIESQAFFGVVRADLVAVEN
ncbi:MAG TPA: DUF3108 domain-containing protein [Candidatus Binataceae bacterium]|nr:DUF3108 domain-containing protein [Candidatus Binataceae bacterium]